MLVCAPNPYHLLILTLSAMWRHTFQGGLGASGVTESSVANELATGKCFFYKYDLKGRPVTYIRPRLHFPSQCDPLEVSASYLSLFEQTEVLLTSVPFDVFLFFCFSALVFLTHHRSREPLLSTARLEEKC